MSSEKNNNQSAPTTVGGVTFGGGNNSPEPAKDDAPQQQPDSSVDPIVQSTGEEFDAVMNGSATPKQDFNQAPIPNVMSTQVASPTHFDSQNTVKPIVVDPGNPNGFQMPQQQQPQKQKSQKTPEQLDKQVKKVSTLAIIFGLLTAVFTILAVVGLVFALNSQTEIEKLNKENKAQASIIKAVEETTGVAPIDDPSKVPVYKATTGYIYISEWSIKIRIPDNLENVSYILNNINFHQSICFNATQKNIQYFPDFANIGLNPGRMGCLTRIKTAEGEFDPTTGISYGEKVFTYKEYSYFYTGATEYSKDEANLGLERTSIKYIYNMIKDNIEQYE